MSTSRDHAGRPCPPLPLRPSPLYSTNLLRPALAEGECPDLLSPLAQVSDPRDPRGLPHPLVGLLAIAAAAVLIGATSRLAISEWAADAGGAGTARPVVIRSADAWQAPCETTIRR
ncbi:transposase family protein [Streptomyces sp. INA 01156]